jgi:hypothetical protein
LGPKGIPLDSGRQISYRGPVKVRTRARETPFDLPPLHAAALARARETPSALQALRVAGLAWVWILVAWAWVTLPPRASAVPFAVVTDGTWFDTVRPHCNTVEVSTALRTNPPPAGVVGQGYGASCYALAGRIEQAQATIDALPASERAAAAGILFEVGHPVADAGDNVASEPMMDLVLRYQPQNFQALYHAGMSAHDLGKADKAREQLSRFLELYQADDFFTQQARRALGELGE